MNYIPGFSKYLQAAVPRYAVGGRAQYAEPVMYDVDRFIDPYADPYVDPYMPAADPYVDPYQYAEPVYPSPSYNAPVYNEPYIDPYMSAEPVYSPPSYNEPVYSEPYVNPYQYAEPVYNEPVYPAPSYNEPVYTPAVEPMTQEVAPAEATPYVSPLEQAVQEAAPVAQPYTPAVQAVEAAPALQAVETAPAEGAAPYDLSALAGLDLSGLNSLYGMNFGSDFGGGSQGGGIYPTNPDLQMFKAPLSSKGNPTAYGDNYISVTSPTQVFRLFDKNTGQVVYEGVGYEGAQEAIKRASALTAEGGAKAQWQIQTPNAQQESGYSVVANEKRNQSTLGDIASFALPVAMAIATGGMSLPAQVAGAAMAGAAGAGLAGKNPIKGGLLSAATAGLGNVSGFNEAVGGALKGIGSAPASAVADTVASGIGNAAGSAGGDIVVSGLSGLAQGLGAGAVQGAASGLTNSLSDITGYKPPAEKFAEQPLPEAQPTPAQPIDAAVDPIVVTGQVPTPSVPNYGGALSGVTEPIAADFLPKSVLPEPMPSEPEPVAQEPAPQPLDAGVEPIVVTGNTAGSGLPFGAAFPVPVEAILNGALTPPAVEQQPLPKQEPVTQEPEEIVVSATKPFDPLGGLAAPIATEFLPTGALPSQQPVTPPAPEPTVEEILVEARKPYTPDVPVSGLAPEILQLIGEPPVEEPSIVVTGREKPVLPTEALAAVPAVGALTAATSGAPNVVNGIDQATGDIVVDATPASVAAPPPIVGVETALPAITQGALNPAQTTPAPDKLTMKDIVDYLRLASLGVSTVGGLLGGGDKGNGAKFNVPAGTGALSSLFNKQLPTSTLPSGGALPASTLAAQGFNSPQDYYRYGYGPEQSFFNYATQGAPNASRAYTGYEGSTAENRFAPQPMRMAQSVLPQPITTAIPNNPAGPIMQERDPTLFARGGFAVEGMGGGRDDKIPALLSDGEYVIDAETVALLGNGSNKAGAELLDSFRVNVRKQKGKKLARGEFSDNAKRPEHYMAGGHA